MDFAAARIPLCSTEPRCAAAPLCVTRLRRLLSLLCAGHVLTRAEADLLSQECVKHNVIVLSDEVYERKARERTRKRPVQPGEIFLKRHQHQAPRCLPVLQ